MSTIGVKKPDWSKELKFVDFRLINEPLEQIYHRIISKLDKENRKPKYFYFILKGLLTTSFQTYKAIRKLVVKNPQYPAQAHILGRVLIDTLFAIVALVDNPEENSKKYEKAEYRIAYEKYERYKTRYGNVSDWQGWIKENEKFLESFANLSGLSTEEKKDPVRTIKYWPIPSQLLCKKPTVSLSDDKKEFLLEIYNWRYRELSECSHMGWGGLAMSIFATNPECHWYSGKFESDTVYTGILFLLMILSEIEAKCNYKEIQRLRYVWTILNNFYDEAKDYYDFRYNNLLTSI